MSKEEILQAIRSCARKLKHNPSRRELRLAARVSEEALHKHFGGLKGAMEKAGLRPSGSGLPAAGVHGAAGLGQRWRASLEKFPQ